VASFYADTDTSVHVAATLNKLGYTVTTSHALGQRRAQDAQQLLSAWSQNAGWVSRY
jgi:hypothetical protein